MSFDELNVRDAVISKVESECCCVKNVLHSLSFICGSNEAILVFLTRDFRDQTA